MDMEALESSEPKEAGMEQGYGCSPKVIWRLCGSSGRSSWIRRHRESDRGGPTGVTSESGGFLPVAFPECPDTTEIGKQTVGI